MQLACLWLSLSRKSSQIDVSNMSPAFAQNLGLCNSNLCHWEMIQSFFFASWQCIFDSTFGYEHQSCVGSGSMRACSYWLWLTARCDSPETMSRGAISGGSMSHSGTKCSSRAAPRYTISSSNRLHNMCSQYVWNSSNSSISGLLSSVVAGQCCFKGAPGRKPLYLVHPQRRCAFVSEVN